MRLSARVSVRPRVAAQPRQSRLQEMRETLENEKPEGEARGRVRRSCCWCAPPSSPWFPSSHWPAPLAQRRYPIPRVPGRNSTAALTRAPAPGALTVAPRGRWEAALQPEVTQLAVRTPAAPGVGVAAAPGGTETPPARQATAFGASQRGTPATLPSTRDFAPYFVRLACVRALGSGRARPSTREVQMAQAAQPAVQVADVSPFASSGCLVPACRWRRHL